MTANVPAEGEDAFVLVQQLRQLAAAYYGDQYHLAGDTVSTFDLKETVESDLMRVNFLVIGAILLILILTLPN